jgi:hypothetical protein
MDRQCGEGDQQPLFSICRTRSDCLIVDFGVGVVGVVGAGVQVLLAAEFEQLDAVVGADLVSEIVEECTRFERAGSRP